MPTSEVEKRGAGREGGIGDGAGLLWTCQLHANSLEFFRRHCRQRRGAEGVPHDAHHLVQQPEEHCRHVSRHEGETFEAGTSGQAPFMLMQGQEQPLAASMHLSVKGEAGAP